MSDVRFNNDEKAWIKDNVQNWFKSHWRNAFNNAFDRRFRERFATEFKRCMKEYKDEHDS